MKLRYFVAIIGFLTTTLIYSQDKQITLEEIWSGAFRTEGMQALHSMKNGKQYSVLNYNRQNGTTTIDIYDYQTLEKVKTLVSSNDIPEIQGFFDYTFSEDESKLILTTNSPKIEFKLKVHITHLLFISYKLFFSILIILLQYSNDCIL